MDTRVSDPAAELRAWLVEHGADPDATDPLAQEAAGFGSDLVLGRIVGDLVEASTEDGTQPRGGLVFGEVLFRHGDYYGPVVNLAARLVDAAIPGEALVDWSVVEALKDDEASFEPAGRRMLRGFDEPVAVWSLAPRR